MRLLKTIRTSKLDNIPKLKGILSITFDRLAYYSLLLNELFMRNKKKGVSRDSEKNIIVSLTSFPKRIDTVWITITTLLNQSVKPNRIILWLSEEEFPMGDKSLPEKLKRLRERGLEIRFCENLKPHKKYYYSMLENPDSIIITFDDDILYPENVIEVLEQYHDKFSESIICNRGHIMIFDNDSIAPYNKWLINPKISEGPRLDVCPTGIGGVLYPPKSLHRDIFNKNDIIELCLNADDLWLKAMSARNETTIVKTNDFTEDFAQIPNTDKVGLTKTNVDKNQNDIQLQKILSKYNFTEKIMNR